MNTPINRIRNFQLNISNLGFAVVPMGSQRNTWCIRTRQDVPVDVIAQLAPRMIMEDPQSVIPKGNIDLPNAYLVQIKDNGGVVDVLALHNKKMKFRTIGFQGKLFYGITTDGDLVTSAQLKDAITQVRQPLVEFSKIAVHGLSQDSVVTSLLAVPQDKQTKVFIGVTTDKANVWLYQGIIDVNDTEIHMTPIEGQFQQVVGIRRGMDAESIVIATADCRVWGAINEETLNFGYLYGYDVTLNGEHIIPRPEMIPTTTTARQSAPRAS